MTERASEGDKRLPRDDTDEGRCQQNDTNLAEHVWMAETVNKPIKKADTNQRERAKMRESFNKTTTKNLGKTDIDECNTKLEG